MILMTQEMIRILKTLPSDSRQQNVLNILERYLNRLQGKYSPMPTKDEIKAAIDALKELRQQYASTKEEYDKLELDAEFAKHIIEWN